MRNYEKYRLALKEQIQVWILSAAICALVGFLFYHSVWSMVLLPLFYFVVKRRWEKRQLERVKNELEDHFMHGLQVLEVSLQAGYSMENAWKEVEKETRLLYGENSCFYQELQAINRTVSFNMPIELLFLTFARRTQLEEIIGFAEILDYGKKTGSNWKKIISDTVLRMLERYETQKEIEVMIAAKHMEQQVMNVIPLGMIFFLKITSWDYMSILYETFLGRFMMSMFLLAYVVAIVISEKIMKIQV